MRAYLQDPAEAIMIDHDLTYLVCQRIDDLPTPPVASRPSVCSECRKRVWVALSSPEGHALLCWQCAGDEFARTGAAEVMAPTKRQLADISGMKKRMN